jgi:hypothetical protein
MECELILVRKTEEKKPNAKHRRGRDDDIKMDLNDVVYGLD